MNQIRFELVEPAGDQAFKGIQQKLTLHMLEFLQQTPKQNIWHVPHGNP